MHTELPNLITLIERVFHGAPWTESLVIWENVIFSLIAAALLVTVTYFATRKSSLIPSRLQCAVEVVAGGIDNFICGILGPQGRKYVPFIGSLFVYILIMNFMGLVPLMKSSTTSWSTTLALALCVFGYVQYTAVKSMGFKGYIDHLMGKPRGIVAFSVVIPILMLFMEIISELVRPISLSLRLRSNIWGDDMLLGVVSGFGIGGVPLVIFSYLLAIIASMVQAVVFCLLTTVYFALVLTHDELEQSAH
jgi:F-type H+-transporting ATPase subunit a